MNYIYIYMDSTDEDEIQKDNTSMVLDTDSDVTSTNPRISLIGSICAERGRRSATAAANSSGREDMQMFAGLSASSSGSVGTTYLGYNIPEGGLRVTGDSRMAEEPYREREMRNPDTGMYEPGDNEGLFKGGSGQAEFKGDQEGNGECHFAFSKAQSFMEWLSLGIDITHDVDEQKGARIARFVIYQRWTKEFCRVTPVQRRQYLTNISDIMRQLPGFQDIWGKIEGGKSSLTFEQYILTGGPLGIEQKEYYIPGTCPAMHTLKDQLTDCLTLFMTRNGRSFVSLNEKVGSGGVVCTLRPILEEATQDEKDALAGVYTPILDTDATVQLFTQGTSVAISDNTTYNGNISLSIIVDSFKNTILAPPASSSTSAKMEFLPDTMGSVGDAATSKKMKAGSEVRAGLTRRSRLMHGTRGSPWSCRAILTSGDDNSREHGLNVTWEGSSGHYDESTLKTAIDTALLESDNLLRKHKGKLLFKQIKNVLGDPVIRARRDRLVDNLKEAVDADSWLKKLGPSGQGSKAKTKNVLKTWTDIGKGAVRAAQNARDRAQIKPEPSGDEAGSRREFGTVVEQLLSQGVSIRRVPKTSILLRGVGESDGNQYTWEPAGGVNGTAGPFHDITDDDNYFLVEVKEDEKGYFVDFMGQKYYLCGRFPSRFKELLLVNDTSSDKQFLPLATVLTLDEAIRDILVDDIIRRLQGNLNGRFFLNNLSNLLTTKDGLMEIFDIFEGMKESFFSVLEHLKRHAHISVTKSGPNMGTEGVYTGVERSGVNLTTTIFHELLGEGGDWGTISINKDTSFTQFVKSMKRDDVRMTAVKRILMGALSLRSEQRPSQSFGSSTHESKSSNVKSLPSEVTSSKDFLTAFEHSYTDELLNWRIGRKDEPGAQELIGVVREELSSSEFHGLILEFLTSKFRNTNCEGLSKKDIIVILELESKSLPLYFRQILNLSGIKRSVQRFGPAAGEDIILFLSNSMKHFVNRHNSIEIMRNVCKDLKENSGKSTLLSYSKNQAGHLATRVLPEGVRPTRLNSTFFDRAETVDATFPILTRLVGLVVDDDNQRKIKLSCITTTELPRSRPIKRVVPVSVKGKASVKRIRTLEFQYFDKFCDKVKKKRRGKKGKQLDAFFYDEWVRLIRSKNPDKVSPSNFEQSEKALMDRHRALKLTINPDADDGNDDGDGGAVAKVKNPKFIMPTGPGLSRDANGTSWNPDKADNGPRSLEMIYKNLAHSCLQVAQGLDPEELLEKFLLSIGIKVDDDIFKEALEYCLNSMTCEGIKTGGDFLQIILSKVMNMLFGLDYERHLMPDLEIVGFTSFDRIATIISGIFNVPTIFINTKGANQSFGGCSMNYTKLPGNGAQRLEGQYDTTATPNRESSTIIAQSLTERMLDVNWLSEFSSSRCNDRLKVILIALLNTINEKDLDAMEDPSVLLKHYRRLVEDPGKASKVALLKKYVEQITEGQQLMLKVNPRYSKCELEGRLNYAEVERELILQFIERGEGTIEDFCKGLPGQVTAQQQQKMSKSHGSSGRGGTSSDSESVSTSTGMSVGSTLSKSDKVAAGTLLDMRSPISFGKRRGLSMKRAKSVSLRRRGLSVERDKGLSPRRGLSPRQGLSPRVMEAAFNSARNRRKNVHVFPAFPNSSPVFGAPPPRMAAPRQMQPSAATQPVPIVPPFEFKAEQKAFHIKHPFPARTLVTILKNSQKTLNNLMIQENSPYAPVLRQIREFRTNNNSSKKARRNPDSDEVRIRQYIDSTDMLIDTARTQIEQINDYLTFDVMDHSDNVNLKKKMLNMIQKLQAAIKSANEKINPHYGGTRRNRKRKKKKTRRKKKRRKRKSIKKRRKRGRKTRRK